MTTMIEKMARAMSEAQTGTQAHYSNYIELAKAALGVMLQPNQVMIDGGMPMSSYYGLDPAMVGAEVTATYTAMIQAALDDKEE